MDPLIDRLRSQTDGMDSTGLTGAAGLPSVVRRGKRYGALATAATFMSVTAAFAAVAVVVPAIVERDGVQPPTVMEMPEEGAGAVEEPKDDAELIPVVEEEPKDGLVPTDGEGDRDADSEGKVDGDGTAPADTTPPALAVLSPPDGATIDEKTVRFSGTVEPGSRVKVGQYAADVADDGTWSIVLIASSGLNTVTFKAIDAAGNVTEVVHRVTYDAPVVASGLTANQKHGELTTAPYRNVYWGTAPAGAKVAVVSEYGTDYAWANDDGDWELGVTFSPPAGTTTFPVTVKLYEQPDVRRSFELTTVKDAVDHPFTANQKRTELTSAPYTNLYWGTTTPGTKVKVLSDFGWNYAYADESGNWEMVVEFTPPAGTTTFQVVARHYDDASVKRTFSLTTVADEGEPFTATQQRGSVAASSPTNTYSGTGEPGHEVWIWTEAHGQWWTTIGGDGTWSIKVTFAEVTAGEVFAVKAKDTWSGAAHHFEVAVTDG